MLAVFARKYVLAGLSSTPDVLAAILKGIDSSDPVWDARPDLERFTLREMVAHLADWDPIFLHRLERIRDEDNPSLPDLDEGQVAIERDYAHQDPVENLNRFRAGRQKLMAFYSAITEEQWGRPGFREKLGEIDAGGMAVLILGHDGYHNKQAIEWLRQAGRS